MLFSIASAMAALELWVSHTSGKMLTYSLVNRLTYYLAMRQFTLRKISAVFNISRTLVLASNVGGDWHLRAGR